MASESIETRLFINGKFTESSAKDSSKKYALRSPTTLEVVADVHEATKGDVDTAVAAAKAAFPAWSALTPPERGAFMVALADQLVAAHAELAHLEALSMGRPVNSYFETAAAARSFRDYAVLGYQAQGTTSLHSRGFVSYTLKQPFGVVAAIIPWNAPLIFIGFKLAPALAAGNTVVLKSSEKAPLTSLKFAACVEKAGFPPGVINVLSGRGAVGAALSWHMDVRMVTFTGSTRTGRLIAEAAAKSNMKNVVLELGGKSPAIVFADADLAAAVADTHSSVTFNSGQVCMANSRIYVHHSVARPFLDLFTRKFAAAALGLGVDPLDSACTLGPVVDRVQFDTVNRYIELGKASGALHFPSPSHEDQQREQGQAAEGAGASDSGSGSDSDGATGRRRGYFVSPTIFTETPEEARIMKEEVFGPVVNINTFVTEEEAISKANDSEYGLFAAVYTKDLDRAMRVSKQLEAGYVGINCTSPTTMPDMPFGGWKGSGLGREGFGYSLNNFLETKTVCIKVASNL